MSTEKEFQNQAKKIYHQFMLLLSVIMVIAGFLVIYLINPSFFNAKAKAENYVAIEDIDEDRIENGIHVRTGLKDADGLMIVVNNCTNCHSAKLITQNRMNAERWNATILWMQQTQNLWDLGKNQEIIVNYLVTNYPVEDKGRRDNLKNINWYDLEN